MWISTSIGLPFTGVPAYITSSGTSGRCPATTGWGQQGSTGASVPTRQQMSECQWPARIIPGSRSPVALVWALLGKDSEAHIHMQDFVLFFLENGQFSLEQYLLGVREAGLGKRRSWTVLSQPFRELWNGHVTDWVMMSPGPLCPCKQAVPGKESWPWARQLPLAKGNCWGGLGYGPARNQQHPGSRRKIVSALKRKLVGVQQDLLPILQLG